ncbi:MAG: acyl-CoA thioesterase/bile acid-CoA:amino acid N-acyltransferase family protein [Solirubrobacteraceae bacterium]
MITATPATGLFDQPRTIVVSHLRPGQRITVDASTERYSGTWTSSANFRANGDGVVNVARSAPSGGSYRVIAAMGLLWSEHLRTPGSPELAHGPVTTLTVDAGGRAVGSARFTQEFEAPGVTVHRETLRSAGFDGTYHATPGKDRRTAVIVWGGSEGGETDTDVEAALMASHGMPALAVAYFDAPGLPCALNRIPLQYFVRAIRWLRSQPQVNPSRVWILSASRGTEAEMLVAGEWPGLVHGVVADAPGAFPAGPYHGTCRATGVTPATGAWTLHGRPVSTSVPLPAARIRGPVMLVSGGADAVWPADLQADQVMKMLPHDGAAHVHLNYPAAGHLVLGVPYYPETVDGTGGSLAADQAAAASDWPAMLRFIAGH